ncbi:MAG TPA: BrnA antitoxin family protein [Acidobacteriaceae bacterium]|jgi:predicted DNA binding CopG/RHH family protein|nr:BrnA antitoxin family protein [Acidobacteriaceae bacterium]
MKKPLKKIPKFKTEQEERLFWEREAIDSTEYVDWSKGALVEFPNLQPSTKTISLRLPQNLLDRIRARANHLDVPYQSLMKVWLAEKAEEVSSQSAK